MFAGSGVLMVVVFGAAQASAQTPAPSLGHATSHFTDWRPPLASSREVDMNTLRSLVSQADQNVSNNDTGILAIEAAMESTYRALPKSSDGLLSHSGAGYLVQKYFIQEHGYQIKGLGADSIIKSAETLSVQDSLVLQTQAPEVVEALLENQRGGRGLTLSDAAAMASVLQGLIMRHGETLLGRSIEVAKRVKHLRLDQDTYDTQDLVTTFRGWEALLRDNSDYINYGTFEKRLDNPTHIMKEFGHVAENVALTKRYLHRNHLNPFKAHEFSTVEVINMVPDVIESMGHWQNADCKTMKKSLGALDPERTGRVPLDVLYEQPVFHDEKGEFVFRFAESQDNLREIGSLDESVPEKPKLLISNYVLGPATCFRMSSYFTYCCLSECDSLMVEIEQSVQGPSAPPELILSLVVNISNSLHDNPVPVSPALASKLYTIAKRHGGAVPLHGRLFAQWLHFAFPLECPYPFVTGQDLAGNSLVTSYMGQQSTNATERNPAPSSDAENPQDDDPALSQWTDDEILPFATAEELGSSLKRIWGSLRTCCIECARWAILYIMCWWAKTGISSLIARSPKKTEGSDWESAMSKLT